MGSIKEQKYREKVLPQTLVDSIEGNLIDFQDKKTIDALISRGQ